MSRFLAETMPAVTVPPRLNGLPIAITQSPSLSLSESPNFTAVNGFGGLNFKHGEVGFLVDADDVGLDLGAVIHDDVDLVGIGDHVVVGDDDAGRIDDEARAERIGLVRLQVAAAALAASAVLEEVVEKFLERRARRQLRNRASAVAAALASIVCEVEMLTTASITFSATSAMPSGPRAKAGAEMSAPAAPRQIAASTGRRRRLKAVVAAVISTFLQKDLGLVLTLRPKGAAAQAFSRSDGIAINAT